MENTLPCQLEVSNCTFVLLYSNIGSLIYQQCTGKFKIFYRNTRGPEKDAPHFRDFGKTVMKAMFPAADEESCERRQSHSWMKVILQLNS